MAHGEALRRASGGDGRKVIAIVEDWRSVPDLNDMERAMLEFTEKITLNAPGIRKEDINHLRDVGFVDEDILQITTIASYYNFISRMADALGVELDLSTERDAELERAFAFHHS